MAHQHISHKLTKNLYAKAHSHSSARSAAAPGGPVSYADLNAVLQQNSEAEFAKHYGYDYNSNPPNLAPGSTVSKIEATITEETDKANPSNSVTHRHGGGRTRPEHEQAIDLARDELREETIKLKNKTPENSSEFQSTRVQKSYNDGTQLDAVITQARAADSDTHATVAHIAANLYKKA